MVSAGIRSFIIVALYASLALAFVTGNWFAGHEPNLERWPDLTWKPGHSAMHAGLDQDRLGRSVQRLPAVRFLRMLGNDLRIQLGQRLEWIVWGEQRATPVLAPKNEIGVSRGRQDVAIKANLDQLIKRLAQYSEKLRTEGWTLYVVPVPSKLSIYREYFEWPLTDTDQLSLQPIDRDHGEELLSYLSQELAVRSVRFVDLQTPFRAEASSNPDRWLYPPGESHWSAYGLALAAKITAARLAQDGLVYVANPETTDMSHVHIGDIVRSMDAFPYGMGRYRPLYYFNESLTQWPVYVPNPADTAPPDASLVVMLGTSYTGQYGWLANQPVGYAQAVGAHLQHAMVKQLSQTGIGGFHPFLTFLERKEELVRDFSQLSGLKPDRIRKFVVWEFPIRDFGYLTAHSESRILHLDNPYGVETHLGRQLCWLGSAPATMTVFASEDGVVEFTADLQPGPAFRPGSPCTIIIQNEAGKKFVHPVIPGTNRLRIPVAAGANRLLWWPREAPEIRPPYSNGDTRTLLVSIYDLQLRYEPGASYP